MNVSPPHATNTATNSSCTDILIIKNLGTAKALSNILSYASSVTSIASKVSVLTTIGFYFLSYYSKVDKAAPQFAALTSVVFTTAHVALALTHPHLKNKVNQVTQQN